MTDNVHAIVFLSEETTDVLMNSIEALLQFAELSDTEFAEWANLLNKIECYNRVTLVLAPSTIEIESEEAA